MNPPEQELEAYRQCFTSKHHYDVLSWSIAAVVVVFVGVLLAVIPKVDAGSEVATLLGKFVAAAIGWAILYLWYRIYERNRLWGEVSNEVAREFERRWKVAGPALAFMKAHFDWGITLKNVDEEGKSYADNSEQKVEIRQGSIHHAIHGLILVLGLALALSTVTNLEI